MKRFSMRAALIAVFITGAVFLLSCNSNAAYQVNPANDDAGLSVWVVYWDLENSLEELSARKDNIEAVSFFAAYFDENETLIIPEELRDFRDDVNTAFGALKWDNYLTVVNDKILSQGSSLKDTGLLKNLFRNEAAMKNHIDSLMEMVKDGGYDGLDIDYEAIRTDMDLWKKFVVFCEKLYERTEKEGVKLRVVLEPNAPLAELAFPEGPEYVMMCYNLYGSGKDTGPKADDAFIKKMIEKMSVMPGKKTFALATGGYSWEKGSTGRQISEKDAAEIIEKSGATVRREKKNGVLTFSYKDDKNVRHTVWYADAQTIRRWQDIILNDGEYNVILWRIGGNIYQ